MPVPEAAVDGFVYRIPGPNGNDYRWLARSVHGQVAHGTTPEEAVESLLFSMQALAEASGRSFEEWQRSQKSDSCFIRRGELVSA